MVKVLRGVGAFFLGLVITVVIMTAVELVNALAFLPKGLNWNDQAAMMAAAKMMPALAFVVVLAGWALSTFCGAWVAARLAPGGKMVFGMALGVLFMVGAAVTMSSFPHPIWMWVIGVAEFLPVAYVAARLATPRPRAGAAVSLVGV